jgi:hypothetical protein
MRAKRFFVMLASPIVAAGALTFAPAAIPQAAAADHASVTATQPEVLTQGCGRARTSYEQGRCSGQKDGRREAIAAARQGNCIDRRGRSGYGWYAPRNPTAYNRGYSEGFSATYGPTLAALCR